MAWARRSAEVRLALDREACELETELERSSDGDQVSTAALTDTFRAAGSSVRLVVLHASYGDAQAEALRAHVNRVIGVRGAVADDAARCFATGFYGCLPEAGSIARAYREGPPDADRLVLEVRTE